LFLKVKVISYIDVDYSCGAFIDAFDAYSNILRPPFVTSISLAGSFFPEDALDAVEAMFVDVDVGHGKRESISFSLFEIVSRLVVKDDPFKIAAGVAAHELEELFHVCVRVGLIARDSSHSHCRVFTVDSTNVDVIIKHILSPCLSLEWCFSFERIFFVLFHEFNAAIFICIAALSAD